MGVEWDREGEISFRLPTRMTFGGQAPFDDSVTNTLRWQANFGPGPAQSWSIEGNPISARTADRAGAVAVG